jgi:hypothetical protein
MKIVLALLMAWSWAALAEPAAKRHFASAELPSQPFIGEHRKAVAPLPAAVAFSLVGGPRIVDGNQVVLKGKISNPLSKEVTLVTFGGNQINPFSLRPLPDAGYRWSTRYPLQPPAPVIPTFQRIPARSEVEYEARFDLGRLEYEGQPTVPFEWYFGFEGQQREPLSGIVSVTLPKQAASDAR